MDQGFNKSTVTAPSINEKLHFAFVDFAFFGGGLAATDFWSASLPGDGFRGFRFIFKIPVSATDLRAIEAQML